MSHFKGPIGLNTKRSYSNFPLPGFEISNKRKLFKHVRTCQKDVRADRRRADRPRADLRRRGPFRPRFRFCKTKQFLFKMPGGRLDREVWGKVPRVPLQVSQLLNHNKRKRMIPRPWRKNYATIWNARYAQLCRTPFLTHHPPHRLPLLYPVHPSLPSLGTRFEPVAPRLQGSA